MREAELKIMSAIIDTAEMSLTFTELKKATGLSPPSLAENLMRLQNQGYVNKNSVTGEYRLTVPGPAPKGTIQNNLVYAFSVAQHCGSNITMAKNVEGMERARVDAMKGFVDTFMVSLSFNLWDVIIETAAGWADTFDTAPAHDLEAIRRHLGKHDLTKLRAHLEDYVTPLVFLLAKTLGLNWDMRNDFLPIIMDLGEEVNLKTEKLKERSESLMVYSS